MTLPEKSNVWRANTSNRQNQKSTDLLSRVFRIDTVQIQVVSKEWIAPCKRWAIEYNVAYMTGYIW